MTNQERIKEIKQEMERLSYHLDELIELRDEFEIDPEDYEEAYEEALDCEGPVYIGSLSYYPSHVLKNVDPVAYRCGLNDFVDNAAEKKDYPEYQEILEEIEEVSDKIDDLDSELDELETELEGD